jgi:hypothetical protein
VTTGAASAAEAAINVTEATVAVIIEVFFMLYLCFSKLSDNKYQLTGNN